MEKTKKQKREYWQRNKEHLNAKRRKTESTIHVESPPPQVIPAIPLYSDEQVQQALSVQPQVRRVIQWVDVSTNFQ